MSFYQASQDESFLRRNNRVIRSLARELPAQITDLGEDEDTTTEILGLSFRGWAVELDYLNTEDAQDYWWTAEKEGQPRLSRTCKGTRHLLNSIKKHCTA